MSASKKFPQKKVVVTCYDASFARICTDANAFDYLLVGDSLGTVIKGESGTTGVTFDQILYHTANVRRGIDQSKISRKPILISDMSIGTYSRPELALDNALRLKAAGAEIVKLEGAVVDEVRALVAANIRVCAHIGLTPQSILDYKVQGKTETEAVRLMNEALALEKAGAELIVFEMIPAELAKKITDALKIPTIGIGAGVHCDGQVLVLYDLLGLNSDFNPKFLKKYLNGSEIISQALQSYSGDVREGIYPSDAHSFKS